MGKLAGKVAVVTGASKGIGAAIAKALALEGASVVVNYASSKAGADGVVASIQSTGGKAVAVGGDVSKASEAKGIVDAAINADSTAVWSTRPMRSSWTRSSTPEPKIRTWSARSTSGSSRSAAATRIRTSCSARSCCFFFRCCKLSASTVSATGHQPS